MCSRVLWLRRRIWPPQDCLLFKLRLASLPLLIFANSSTRPLPTPPYFEIHISHALPFSRASPQTSKGLRFASRLNVEHHHSTETCGLALASVVPGPPTKTVERMENMEDVEMLEAEREAHKLAGKPGTAPVQRWEVSDSKWEFASSVALVLHARRTKKSTFTKNAGVVDLKQRKI